MSKLFTPMAIVYDEMINWEKRLERELPLFREVFADRHRLLDVACATGRHAIALANTHEIVGIDISEEMISQAKHNARLNSISEKVQFYATDVLDISPELGPFDGGYILANSLGNMASRDKVVKFLKLMRELIPEGPLLGQTVNLPNEINYLPLRFSSYQEKDVTVQRIMIPVADREETHHLHFNLITDQEEYLSQSRIPLFGITPEIFKEILAETSWELNVMYGGYDKRPVRNEIGSALVWILQ